LWSAAEAVEEDHIEHGDRDEHQCGHDRGNHEQRLDDQRLDEQRRHEWHDRGHHLVGAQRGPVQQP
jgi:hypothetical protein